MSLLDVNRAESLFDHNNIILIFPREYKRDLEHCANYALEICEGRGRSMNVNNLDIMEQYCRPHITPDKFSPDESYRKNCVPKSEIIIVMQPGRVNDRMNLNEFLKSRAVLPVYQIIRKQTDKCIVRQPRDTDCNSISSH